MVKKQTKKEHLKKIRKKALKHPSVAWITFELFFEPSGKNIWKSLFLMWCCFVVERKSKLSYVSIGSNVEGCRLMNFFRKKENELVQLHDILINPE